VPREHRDTQSICMMRQLFSEQMFTLLEKPEQAIRELVQ
jgi:uncharacterized protein with von Willebrand factor type A (vWA) domain